MTANWKVTYGLTPHALVVTPVDRLSNSIELQYDFSGQLAAISHSVAVADNDTDIQVIAKSRKDLTMLFEALSFMYGPIIDFNAQGASRISLEDGTTQIFHQLLTVEASAVPVKPLALPPMAVLQEAPKRLSAWLHLANLARDTSNDADAIRHYYLALDDMRKGGIDDYSPKEEQYLKYVRHFVSHGVPLDNDDAIAFLKTELGSPVHKYNPLNPKHQLLLSKWREHARAIVDGELGKYLPLSNTAR